jgi:20S proteasome alpha/beta subunit
MTIILAQKTTTGVLMAADCLMVEEPRLFRRANQKLVQVAPRIAVGTAGLARLGNAVRLSSFWETTIARHELYEGPNQTEATLFRMFSDLLKDESKDAPFWAIVAVDREIFYVGINGSVTREAASYSALGSGELVALGAMFVLRMLREQTKGGAALPTTEEAADELKTALCATVEHVQAIRPPWVFAETVAPPSP